MKVLVTGAAGQVGAELMRAAWPDGTELVGLDRSGLDVADAAAVAAAVADVAPDVIVNAAAYTAVDRAESEPDLADAVNAAGPGHLATAASAGGARLIHLSTDYVFDGTAPGWYVETDPIAPLGAYGRSKAAGEAAVAAGTERHLILRTAWVYGALGANFVATMRRLAADRDELRVVADQRGCPTSAADIAAAIVALCADTGSTDELAGVFHLASPIEATWHELACAALADRIDAGSVVVHPITTAEYPTPAPRPANSRLDSGAVAAARGVVLPDWRDSVKRVVAELVASGRVP